MISKEKEVLQALCEGEINFDEAAEILNCESSHIDNLLYYFDWISSSYYLRKYYPNGIYSKDALDV